MSSGETDGGDSSKPAFAIAAAGEELKSPF
jgi:hypothetical protein